MLRVGVVVAGVLLAGCSFTIGAGAGSKKVTKTHEYVDAALGTVSGVACVIAAVAWQAPDEFAPHEDFLTGEKTWNSPRDRANTQQLGATLATLTCPMMAAFLASGIYGHVVAPHDGSTGSGADFAMAAAAFANGFLGAAQPSSQGYVAPQPYYTPKQYVAPPPAAQICSSDFGCQYGYRCVKARYELSGYCAKAVDAAGLPTYHAPDPSSVMPNMGDDFDCETEGCPAGFRCDVRSGVCLR